MTIPLARTLIVASTSLTLATTLALAQTAATAATPAKPLAFDVISIKPDKGTSVSNQMLNGEPVISVRMMMRNLPDGFSAANMNVKSIIASAYQTKQNSILGGPDWISTDRYDIEAKVTSFDPPSAHELTTDQRNQMLQSLLVDRFHLAVHNETKEGPIYELTLAKGGPKLKPADDVPPPPAAGASSDLPPGAPVKRPIMMRQGPGNVSSRQMSTAQLADSLSTLLHRPVVDKTGLTGKYDITLQYTPDNTPADAPNANGPTVFTALQEQLGLKLDSAKGPVTTLVIDHIEPPSEN